MVGKVKVQARIHRQVATVLQMVVGALDVEVGEKWLAALDPGHAICTGISGLFYVWDGSRQLSAHPPPVPSPGLRVQSLKSKAGNVLLMHHLSECSHGKQQDVPALDFRL